MRYWWIVLLALSSQLVSAQMSDDDVDGLGIRNLPGGRVQLTWKADHGVPCQTEVTYSVFRSKKDDFEPDESNRLLTGIKVASVVLSDSSSSSYYHVRAVRTPIYCTPQREPGFYPSLTIHPIDGDKGALFATLRTKWRQETAQKGNLSYIVHGTYLGSGDPAVFYKRVRECDYTLQLVDAHGFKITELAVHFLGVTGTSDTIIGIEANDVTTVTSEQYRDFGQNGDWNLTWACFKN